MVSENHQDKMLKHFLNPPNWFTFAQYFLRVASIMTAANTTEPTAFIRQGLLIIYASIFDMLDGRVARITGRGSDFGIQLDSLADVVSFGVAFAVLVYLGTHHWAPSEWPLPSSLCSAASCALPDSTQWPLVKPRRSPTA